MKRLDTNAIDERLEALYRDLQLMPATSLCPWPVARMFNKLLSQAKDEIDEDLVLRQIQTLKQHPSDDFRDVATAHVGTVVTLIGQLRVALRQG
jgi:hypothetical protein